MSNELKHRGVIKLFRDKRSRNLFKNLILMYRVVSTLKLQYLVLVLFIFTFGTSLIPLLNIELTKNLINNIQIGSGIKVVIIIFSIMLTVQFISRLLAYYSQYLKQILHLKLNNMIPELIMNRISGMKFDLLFNEQTQNELYFLRTQTSTKISTIIEHIFTIFSSIITISSMWIYLIQWNPLYALIVTLFSLPIGFVQLHFNKKKFNLSKELNKKYREQFYLLYISTTSQYIKEIVEHSSMKYLISLHSSLFKKIFAPTKSLNMKEKLSNFSASLLGLISVGYLEFKIILTALNGEILLGTLTSLLQALNNVAGGIQKLILSISGFYNDWLYVNSLRSFLEKEEDREEEEVKIQNTINLSARNLCFSIGEKVIFENINFDFKPGSIVGITGSNGCGKTTLLEVLHGIKKQTSGEIYFNNIPSVEFKDNQRIEISQMLHQTPARYELTLNENIGISDPNKLLKENIKDYVNSIDPNTFLNDNNLNVSTRLGEWYEDSRSLSGGQWQSISIYRLFYNKSFIYLLDEPTNNLDNKSLKKISSIIKNSINENSIIILVSHDLEFISEVCSEVYTMTSYGIEQNLPVAQGY
jgi:ATP-binding cassette, subfamily B, bacterial NisT/SpaT